MSDDIYFDKRKNKNASRKPYDYEQNGIFEDIYSDSSSDPNYRPVEDPFSDWNELPSYHKKTNGDISYNDFKPKRAPQSQPARTPRPDRDATMPMPTLPRQETQRMRQPVQQVRQPQRHTAPPKEKKRTYTEDISMDRRQGVSQLYSAEQPARRSVRATVDTAKEKAQKSRRKGGSSFGKKLLCLVLVLVLLYAGLSFVMFGRTDYDGSMHKKNQYVSSMQLKQSPFVENILLLGVDARPGETVSRSDTMLLVSIDKLHGKIKLSSFLRDSYVNIPGYGMNKLNAACSKGGTQLVIDTIESNYGIKINKYAQVDFNAFVALIDAIGGVDVKVTEKEANYLNRTWKRWSLTGNPVHFDSGESVHLDGEKALLFVRIRKLDSDFMRTDRQRRVISAVKQQVSSVSPAVLFKLVNTVMPNIVTDMHTNQIMNKGLGYLLLYRHYDIEQLAIPYTGTWHSELISGVGDSLVFDIPTNASILQNFIYKDKLPEK